MTVLNHQNGKQEKIGLKIERQQR